MDNRPPIAAAFVDDIAGASEARCTWPLPLHGSALRLAIADFQVHPDTNTIYPASAQIAMRAVRRRGGHPLDRGSTQGPWSRTTGVGIPIQEGKSGMIDSQTILQWTGCFARRRGLDRASARNDRYSGWGFVAYHR
jgi:hypothetical protein